MQLDPDKFKMGQIVLVHYTKKLFARIVTLFTGDYYTHAFVSGGGYDIIDTHLKVKLGDLQRYKNSELLICSVKDMPKDKMNKVAFYAATSCHKFYDPLQLLFIAITLKFPKFRRVFAVIDALIDMPICSQTALNAILRTGWNVLNGHEAFEFRPQHFCPSENPFMQEDFHYGEEVKKNV